MTCWWPGYSLSGREAQEATGESTSEGSQDIDATGHLIEKRTTKRFVSTFNVEKDVQRNQREESKLEFKADCDCAIDCDFKVTDEDVGLLTELSHSRHESHIEMC